MGGAYGPPGLNAMLPLNQNPLANIQFPFLEMLEFPNLSKLINDPIIHHLAWLPIPVKISVDISKFDGRMGEDPTSHITSYHLWCVSNSMLDDSINLHIFPHNLTRNASKWFTEIPTTSLLILVP